MTSYIRHRHSRHSRHTSNKCNCNEYSRYTKQVSEKCNCCEDKSKSKDCHREKKCEKKRKNEKASSRSSKYHGINAQEYVLRYNSSTCETGEINLNTDHLKEATRLFLNKKTNKCLDMTNFVNHVKTRESASYIKLTTQCGRNFARYAIEPTQLEFMDTCAIINLTYIDHYGDICDNEKVHISFC